MKQKLIFSLLIISLLVSCGKSKEKIELEKAKIELEKTKLELEKKTKKEEQLKLEKIHEQKVNVGKRKKITELNLILQELPEAIKQAKRNIEKINEFQIGRSLSTKEKQLKAAREKLSNLYEYKENIKNEIALFEFHKTFEFQKSPTEVMNYIFQSAKKEDFSNFRYLCDPYGENDSDVKQICYAQMLLNRDKSELKDEYGNGRVIGEPKFNGDKAEVEFAYGISSNRLEKMNFIKRNGFWYLSGF